LGFAGCPGSLDEPERFTDGGGGGSSTACPPGYDVETDLFQASCSSKVCHDSDQPEANLDLSGASAFANMNGVSSSDGACASRLLIDPSNPAQSFLLEKLTSATPQCGDQMPLGVKALSADKIDCVKKWIADKTGTGTGGSGGADAASGGSGGADASSGGSAGAAGSSDSGAE